MGIDTTLGGFCGFGWQFAAATFGTFFALIAQGKGLLQMRFWS